MYSVVSCLVLALLMEGKKEGILHEFNLDTTWPSRGDHGARLNHVLKSYGQA